MDREFEKIVEEIEKSLFPKLTEKMNAPKFYQVDDLYRYYKIKKTSIRGYIKSGLIIPDIESRGKRFPHLFNICNVIQIGLMKTVVDFGMTWKKASRLAYSLEQHHIQELISKNFRYLVIYGDNSGKLSPPILRVSLEYDQKFTSSDTHITITPDVDEKRFEEFDKYTKILLVVDFEKILQHVEAVI